MLQTKDITLNFGSRTLFSKVTLKFIPGNCYGLIGANGAGKSTFLKILNGEIDEYSGEIDITSGHRISTLSQEHNAFDKYEVVQTVIMGDTTLSDVMQERDAIYAKEDFSDEDGLRAGELEEKIEELGGYEAEANAGQILSGLGVQEKYHSTKMSELIESDKVKVLLAQAIFGDPDILLLDEPTNGLDIHAIKWLENFLSEYNNTVIVVSHDRHFLNTVCTHIADIDYGKITIFTGNYDFWFQSSQLINKMARDQKKKTEDKAKELKAFIARFSANASKSKQATSRKKALEKLELEDLKASTRKFPYLEFKPEKDLGKDLLVVDGLSKSNQEKTLIDNINFEMRPGDKVAFVGDELAISELFNILAEEKSATSGELKWGITTIRSYLPADNTMLFNNTELNLIDWLRQFSKDQDESYIRGFLGRMLFSGDEAKKSTKVLSGGEKVRMVLSKLMLSGANVLILDHPTSHLDLESIQALNNGLVKFKGSILFASHDQQFVETIANRIFELKDGKLTIYENTFSEYLAKHESTIMR